MYSYQCQQRTNLSCTATQIIQILYIPILISLSPARSESGRGAGTSGSTARAVDVSNII